MPLPYRNFATWTLQDLALRRRTRNAIIFEGNHSSAHFPLPVREEGESLSRFRLRRRTFLDELPRESDFSERLALAFRALCLSGLKQYSAADDILAILLAAPAEKKAGYEASGIGYAYKPIDSNRGSTKRGWRRKRKKRGVSMAERQADAIRSQANRFIRSHNDFDGLFHRKLEYFRFRLYRDSEWHAENESHYLGMVQTVEQTSDALDWSTVGWVIETAYFFHEQERYVEAFVHYLKSIRATKRAEIHEDLRLFVVYWMFVGAKACCRSLPIQRMPSYDGPWLSERPPNSPKTPA